MYKDIEDSLRPDTQEQSSEVTNAVRCRICIKGWNLTSALKM